MPAAGRTILQNRHLNLFEHRGEKENCTQSTPAATAPNIEAFLQLQSNMSDFNL